MEDGSRMQVKASECRPFNKSSLKRIVSDLTLLDDMAAQLILHNLKKRFHKGTFFFWCTALARVCLVVMFSFFMFHVSMFGFGLTCIVKSAPALYPLVCDFCLLGDRGRGVGCVCPFSSELKFPLSFFFLQSGTGEIYTNVSFFSFLTPICVCSSHHVI